MDTQYTPTYLYSDYELAETFVGTSKEICEELNESDWDKDTIEFGNYYLVDLTQPQLVLEFWDVFSYKLTPSLKTK